MANSEVSICNMALVRLGQSRISSMTQQGRLEAELSSIFYEPTVSELLTDYEWAFATERASLAVSAETNLTNYTYKYTIPNNCLRIISFIDGNSYADITDDWAIEGKYVYSNTIPGYIKYIRTITNPSVFPQLFVEALYLRLATKMCLKMTQDQSLLGMLFQEYSAALRTAMSVCGANSKAEPVAETLWSE